MNVPQRAADAAFWTLTHPWTCLAACAAWVTSWGALARVLRDYCEMEDLHLEEQS